MLTEENFLPAGEAMQLLTQRDELIPQPETKIGHGPAKYYLLKQTGTLVGFIGALTNPHFCEACNKMRLTADGKIRPCLGDHGEIDLVRFCASPITMKHCETLSWKHCVLSRWSTNFVMPTGPIAPCDRHRRDK